MMTNKEQTKHYKQSLTGYDTWTIMCPVKTYSFERKLSIDDSKSRVLTTKLLLHCNIRYPNEIAESFIEICIWQNDEFVVADNIDEDYVGIGVFYPLGREVPENLVSKQFQSNQQGNFGLSIPLDSDTIQEFGDALIQSEANPYLHREFYADIAGLLNEWNGKGNLCVTNFSLVVSGQEQHDEILEP